MPEFPPLNRRVPRKGSTEVDRVVRRDMRSADWDGGGDLSSGADSTATAGYLLDYGSGSAQFQNIYAEGGSLGTLDVTDTISVGNGGVVEITGTGMIRSAASGLRYELGATGTYARIDLYSGHADETNPAFLRQSGGATPATWLHTPLITGVDPHLALTGGSVAVTGYTYAGVSCNAGDLTVQAIGGDILLTPYDANQQILINGGALTSGTDGTAALPVLSFANDPDTGIYRSASNVFAIATGGTQRFKVQTPGTLSATGTKGTGALVVPHTTTLGSTAGNMVHIASFGVDVTNDVYLELQGLRDAAGSTWTTAAIGFRRVTDSTGQASLWWYGDNIGVGLSGPSKTLHVAGTFAARPGTTASAANAYWNNYTGSEYELLRSTSSRRYKDDIVDAPELANIDLRPRYFWSKLDGRYQYGLIAEEVAAAIPEAAVYSAGDEIENYDDRAVIATLAAKINRLEGIVL